MKIQIPEKLIKLLYNFMDFETSGESSKPDMRLYEYSWVLSKLVKLQVGAILDVGCTARMNMIPASLCRQGWKVVGVDIRDYQYKHNNFTFIRGSLIPQSESTIVEIQSEFDIVTAISSIEHFGLKMYGNKDNYPTADIHTIRVVRQLLKRQGVLFLTVPFTYGEPYIMNRAARVYNTKALHELLEGFKVLSTETVTVGKDRTIMIEAIKT